MSVAQKSAHIPVTVPLSPNTNLRAVISSRGPQIVIEQVLALNSTKTSSIHLNFNDILQLDKLIQIMYNLHVLRTTQRYERQC